MRSKTKLNAGDSAADGAVLGGQSASRRRFLGTALAGVSLAGALPAVALQDAPVAPTQHPSDPLEELLQRYGSELGGTTRIKRAK